MSDEMMVQLLQLSQKYQSKSAREHGLKRLQNRLWHISPTKLVSISLKYQIKDVFEHAFSQLVQLHVNKLDCDILTIPVWNTLIMAKEQLDLHRRIVACEPPPMVHLTRCQDRKTCDDDWRQVWWNGMGRFLLDGRNPLSFDDAMRQFQDFDYGAVCPDCWRQMLDFCKQGKAFTHERRLIDNTCQELASRLIKEPTFDSFNDSCNSHYVILITKFLMHHRNFRGDDWKFRRLE
ncbi:hypothetical protein SCLCIDRAFT_30673 [Scleroderma citrinum Foug A]|uniref:Uncharacterized protein n=1 Tax=Scleroderma citrinum Foug A TaxID=1036808 RepID=A0A0C3DG60_9AGAM|nr:hypothetical protein SCLCIDRAFT_30673 [Scleroderma citrinum Foug A]